MRKIESAKEAEDKKKNRGRYFAIVMLVILLGSTAGYAFLSNPAEKAAKGQEALLAEEGVKIGGSYIKLMSTKNETKDIDVEVSATLGDYSGKKVYVSADNQGVLYELGATIGQYASSMQEACYGNCTQNLPEKTCSDLLIVWKQSQENRVYQKDNCVFIEGDTRAVDALIYRIFE